MRFGVLALAVGFTGCAAAASPAPAPSPAPPGADRAAASVPSPAGFDRTRLRILALNALCQQEVCGGSLMVRFHSLICQADESRCLFGFRMVTERSTRGDLRPAEFLMDYEVGPDEHELEARIYAIEGPGTCSPFEEGTDGPCSALEGVCVVYGIESDAQYDERHGAGLTQCLSELERDIVR